MPSIDERVVSMAFENAKFEAGVAKTMASLTKLNATLKTVGTTHGFGDIEKAANKVTLSHPISALDKLKTRLFGAGQGASEGLGEIDKAGNKVTLEGPIRALDKVRASTASVGRGAADGFNEIEKAGNRVTFSGVGRAINGVISQLNVLEIAAGTVLGNIATQSAARGAAIAKSLSLGPITQGFQEYSTNLNSIQTILANTKASGAGLRDVNKALRELNEYSDQTIYNFSQMAKNIGTFTAAGVDLETATGSIKGIANLAALSGSNSEQASTAMYQLSQAISAGRVGLQDWNSVVNAGMGGTVFQRALAQTAVQMGKLEKGAVKLVGPMKNVTISGESFRDSMNVTAGGTPWITGDVLTKTLQQFTGDLSDAELAAQGFNKAQIKAIQETAKTAKLAATEVKTLSGVFDVVKESIGSGWAATFQLIFGDFEEAKSTFTDLSNAITGFVGKNADARNKVLGDWKKLGGRKDLIEGIKNVFEAFGSVIKPIKDAFRDIFPAKTGKDLFELTKRFRDFTKELKIGPETAENLKRTFKGFFAILSIGKTIVGEILGVIGDLFGAAGEGSGGFLALTGGIGDFLVSIDKAIREGKGLSKFFDGLSSVLQVPIDLFGALAGAIGSLFEGGDDSAGLSKSLGEMESSLSPMSKALAAASKAWEGFLNVLRGAKKALGSVIDDVGEAFGGVGDAIADAFENADYDKVFAIIQTTLIGGIFFAIKKALSGGLNFDFGGGVLESMSGTLDSLTGSLKAMQRNIQADTLLKIASAVAVLAAGVLALSLIDPKKLGSAMTAVAVGLGELVGAMALLSKIGGAASFALMPIIASGMIGLAIAVDLLAIAVFAFSKLSWEELAKGLAGVGGALTAIALGVKLIPKSIALIGPALIPIAIALNLMALAVKIFSTLDWEEMAKGLTGVAGALTAIGVGTKLIGPSVLLIGPGLIGVAVALNLLSLAVLAFGKMDLETMGKGLLGIAGSLTAIGLAVGLIPPTVALQAAGLILLSVALTGIAGAVALMGGMDIETIAKGLAAIGVSLVVLAGGLTLMGGTIPGTIALMGAATALAVLAPVLGVLGAMKWGTIAKGLAAIAAMLGVISVVGLVAAPALTALGISLIALGAGVALVGAGVYLLTTGIAKLGTDGSKGIAAVMVALTALVALLPKIIIDFVKGLVDIAEAIASLAPKLIASMVKVITLMINAGIQLAPKVATLAIAIVAAFVKTLNESAPGLIDAGWKLLLTFLKGIENNIAQVVTTVGNIMLKFLGAVISFLPKLVASGAKALFEFLKGIATGLPKVLSAATTVLAEFLKGIAKELPKVLSKAGDVVVSFIKGITNKVDDVVDAGVKLVIRVIRGITNSLPQLADAGVALISRFILEIGRNAPKLADAGAKAVIKFLDGTARAIRANSDDLGRAGADIGIAIVEGMIRGMTSLAGRLADKALGLVTALPGKVKKFLGINSPSLVFAEIGKSIGEGLSLGIGSNSGAAINSSLQMGNNILSAFRTLFQIQSPSKVMHEIGQFVGQGFANGLVGSQDDIRNAFTSLQSKLSDAIQTLKTTIATEQDKLDKLRAAKKPDEEAIKRAQESIKKNNDLLERSRAVHASLTGSLRDEKKELLGLAKDYEGIAVKLAEAQQALTDATKVRDDATKSFTDQYSTLPEIDFTKASPEQVALYTQGLTNQAKAVTDYKATLDQLRALGLDDTTYKKLLAEGTKAQEFATQLLAGGKAAVDGVNILDAQLLRASEALAASAASNLYQAGVDAATGLVKGLTDKQSEIYAAMEKIATAMIKAIRKKLKIKSPSKEFAKIGKFASIGLADGLSSSAKIAVSAATDVADEALLALKDSMSALSDLMMADIDTNPTITPILDLSSVQREAKKLTGLTNVTPITAAASYNQAAAISAAQEAAQAATAETEVASVAPIRFEQNNYSPESLSPTEIYRQTRNQLAQAKSALGLVS